MRKKPIIMMATMLIALLLLTPIVKAPLTHYCWDNIQFVDGTNIDYPHPDNVHYDISNTKNWARLGYELHHYQINKDTTHQIIVGSLAFSTFVGVVVTLWLGGGTGAVLVGAIAGLVLAAAVNMVIDYYFVDERDCIWWWVNESFVDWIIANFDWLVAHLDLADTYIAIAFANFGYLRLGMVTFHDAIEKGDPHIMGDIDGDGRCDITDLYYVTIGYGMAIEDAMAKYGVPQETDIDNDGKIDFDDLYYVMMGYGE